ncbi:hypothetical protein EYZ11_007573 [Aspergillus tanneri]|uniref:Cytochrome P450 n=1 Tax=Aspergillus tanneri TaxID=1220188 RepID=A0A4S3JD27_9EURO|nr:hypothetical protein EYZ11_007573 [Aspergillus tanneri]
MNTTIDLSFSVIGISSAIVYVLYIGLGIGILKRNLDATDNQVLQIEDWKVYHELDKRSTWYQNVLGYWHHVTNDPKNVQAILATQFNDFELGPVRKGSVAPFLGTGIFSTDGKEWQHNRALLRPQFSRGQVADLQLEETHVQHLFRRLPVSSDSWTDELDLMPLFFNLTLDSATEFLFGQSVHSQSMTPSIHNELGKKDQLDWASFGKSFDAATVAVNARAKLMDLYYLYSPQSFKENCKEVHRFAEYYVDLALSGLPPSGHSDKKESYIFLQELAKETRDRTELRNQLLHILLAGRDTTAGLLGWTFYLLARHPHIYAKLREIILDRFGPVSNTSVISFESLKSCSYLQQVMSEALRLYPIVPTNSRRCVRNTTLPRGGGADGLSPVYVRAGEEVVYNVHIMHRRKDIWGQDADEFHPERWEGYKPGWEYLPFNGGPRICLGQQFALTEAGYVTVRLLQKFDRVENLDKSTVTKQRSATATPVKLLLRLHEA